MAQAKKKATGYDKFVNWKLLIIPVVLFTAILLLPTPQGMKKVGMQYSVGPKVVTSYLCQELFQKKSSDCEQWEILTARMMEQNMRMGALSKERLMKRNEKWAKKYKIPVDSANFKRALSFVDKTIPADRYMTIMKGAFDKRMKGLDYQQLSEKDQKSANKGAWSIKVAIAMVVFVVFCFMTECMPLPGVAFCIGLILVFTGVISRSEVAGLYWDDAVWFIMGSLMFAAAFVKTGVDKRMCLMMFKKLAVPNVRWITLIFFIVIAPLAAFISDHALAAMFLPIGMLLYQNSLTDEIPRTRNWPRC